MIRLVGVDIPHKINVVVGLTKIYGIGKSRALSICKKLNINIFMKFYNLNSLCINNIVKELNIYILEGKLKKIVKNNIKNLINIKCYRGDRHFKNLPCRGQRTRTNARTRKMNKINF